MKNSLMRLLAIAATSACLSLPLAAQTSTAVNRVAAPIDETNLVPLHGNVHPLAQARFDRGPAPVSTPTGRIMLVLERSASQQQALTQYLADLQNPSSSSYHKWLTPAQYGARYGISDSDLQTVQTWLQAHGFKIEKVPQARNVIEFSGNFEQIQSAFHTTMHSLLVNGENHFANMTDPQIPAALAPVVAGVGPLNDFHPKAPAEKGPRGHFDAATKKIVPDFTLTSNSGASLLFLDPADASTVYDTPNANLNANYKTGTTYDGTGVSIGIGGTSDLSLNDVENYRTGFLGESTTNANLPTVIVDGNDPGIVSGWAVEALLDNEVSGGLAPKAKVYFYTSADTDLSGGFVDSVYRAIDDNAVSILSLSIASCEQAMGNTLNQEVLEGYEQAAAQGITVVVAASDNGSAGCDNFDTGTAAQYGFAVNGFASTPYNVAVGGTDFDKLAASFSTYASAENSVSNGPPYYETALQYIPENPWNDSTTINTTYADNVADSSSGSTNIVAGSGGFSSCVVQTNSGVCESGYSVPAFQASVTPFGLANTNKVRMVPDVSFFAGAGDYDAAWVVCSDPASDGSSQSYTECQNNNGLFTDTTYFTGVGGTSASAPAFAGMLALVAQAHGSASDNYRLGQIDPILYQLAANATTYAAVFHDIKVGNNSVVCASGSPNCGTNGFLTGYNAGTGYDLASGYGSADITALVKNWTNVSLGSTSTTLKINNSTATYTGTHGADLTFDVGVTPTTATGFAAVIDNADETAGGTAQGQQNNGQIAVPIASGAGTVQYNGLPGGDYTVYARYGGDTTSAASTSAGISVKIAAEASTTALQVNAYNPQSENVISGTSFPYGTLILADAEIYGTAEGANNTQGTATGTVAFKNGTSTLGTINVSATGNLASYPAYNSSYPAFAPGSYSITAVYSGDASYSASTSTAQAFSVVKAGTTTAAAANPTTVSSGGSTTITVTITTPANDGAYPTGSAVVSLGGTTLTTITNLTSTFQLSGSTYNFVTTGTGTVSASQLAAGSNTLTVAYSGDNNYTTSSSAPVTVTGPSGSSSGTLTMSNNGAITVAAGATTGNTSTVTVTPGGGFTGAVNLTCAVTTSISNPNDPPTCSIPSSVTISGTTAATATVTVATTASSTSTSSLASPLNKFFLGGGATLALVFFLGIPGRRRAWRAALSVVALIVIAGAVGCGGGGGTKTTTIPGTTAGAYTVTVTGTDAATGKITASTAVGLTVN